MSPRTSSDEIYLPVAAFVGIGLRILDPRQNSVIRHEMTIPCIVSADDTPFCRKQSRIFLDDPNFECNVF